MSVSLRSAGALAGVGVTLEFEVAVVSEVALAWAADAAGLDASDSGAELEQAARNAAASENVRAWLRMVTDGLGTKAEPR